MDSRMIPQNSPEWYEVRLGRFTASTNSKLIYKPKKDGTLGEITKDVRTHIIDKVGECRFGKEEGDYKSTDMERGHDSEPRAAVLYMMQTGIPLMKTGFWKIGDHAGASPDRITFDKKGGAEFKSPRKKNHNRYSILAATKDIKRFKVDCKAYYWQCVTCMIALKADYWDFCSYYKDSERKIEELAILRIPRNEEDIKLLHACLKKAIDKKKYYLNLLNGEL